MSSSACISGARFALALISWCLASIGVLLSFLSIITLTDDSVSHMRWLVVPLPALAWVALAVMTVRWLQGRRCHWIWPILGTVAGLMSAASFFAAFFIFVSAVPLAIYLVWWHLKPKVA